MKVRKSFVVLVLTLVIALGAMPATANAVEPDSKTAKAVFDDTKTLTFYYDSIDHSGKVYDVPANHTGFDVPWGTLAGEVAGEVETVKIDASFSNFVPVSTAWWFYNMQNLTSIVGIENINTSALTNISGMFCACKSLESLDLRNFHTTHVQNFNQTFEYDASLKTLLLPEDFCTSAATDLGSLFSGCKVLSSIDVSNFDTINVTNLSGMFSDCAALTSIDVSNFNPTYLTGLSYMFSGCSAITELDLRTFDTKNVRSMAGMFKNCSSLKTIYVSRAWNITGLGYYPSTSATDMFLGCTNLVGWKGTRYSDGYTGYEYARIDNGGVGDFGRGYLSIKPVARIGQVKYENLWQAVNAIENMTDKTATIVLLEDTKTYITVFNGYHITLDLNGHIIDGHQASSVIINKGALTIIDSDSSAQHSKVYSDFPAGGLITGGAALQGGGINNSGDLTINGGTIYGCTAEEGSGIYNSASGTFIMHNGIISCNGDDYKNNGGTVSIYGGWHSSKISDPAEGYISTGDMAEMADVPVVNGHSVAYTVILKDSVIAGDVNYDGTVSSVDLTTLLRHVAKIELLKNTDFADVNDDGFVDAKDVTFLAQMLAA